MSQKSRIDQMKIIIYFVIALVYNICVFVIFSDFNAVFWASYVFMIIAFLIHIACFFSATQNKSIKAIFFGIPLISFSIYFVLAELFCSTVFMIFKESVSIKVAIVIQVLLLCVFVIIAAISIIGRDTVINTENRIKENVSFIKSLNVEVEMMIQRSTDSRVTEALKKLSETVKYSDPMSNRTVEMQERMIVDNMTNLRMAFDSNDTVNVLNLCKNVELLFIERNKKLMVSK